MPETEDQGDPAGSHVAEPGEAFPPKLESFRSALDAGQVGVWSWDLRSHQMTWSTKLENFHGLSEDSIDGSLSIVPQDFPSQDAAGVFAAIHKTLQTREPCRLEYRLPGRSDREERWFEALVTVILQDGAAVQMLGMCRDVTERLRVNREVRVRARQQETLARLGERALTDSDLQKFFNEVVTTVGEILDVELVNILELLPGDAELLLRAGIGWKPGLVGSANISTGRDTEAGYTLASGRPVIVEDLASETRFSSAALLHDHGVVSGLATPIAGRDGRAYGVLGAHTKKRRKFHDYDVSFLAAVANVVAGAIQRRQLDQRHELMIRELRHRSGNLFSQLLALFSQTAKNSRSVADLVAKYEARVLALANAHRLITEEAGNRPRSTNCSIRCSRHSWIESRSGAQCLSRAGSHLRSEHGGARARDQREQARQPFRAGRPRRCHVVDHAYSTGLTLVLVWNESGGPAPKRTRRPVLAPG